MSNHDNDMLFIESEMVEDDDFDLFGVMEELYKDDPLASKFLEELKKDENMMDIDHFVNSFIENNADMPGMDEFAKLMYRGPLPERLDQAENIIKEYKETCKQIKWENDEEKNAAYETLFLAYTTLIRLYETNCMYRLSINTAFDAIDTMLFASDAFLSIFNA